MSTDQGQGGDADEFNSVCRFCGLELDSRPIKGEDWHNSCVASGDDESDVRRLSSNPMYGHYGVPVGYQA